MESDEFLIYLGNTLIGVAKNITVDMPNTIGMFEPTPEFAAVSQLFEHEYTSIKGHASEWRKAKDEIFSLGLRLERKSTGEVIKSVPGAMPGPTFRNEIAYLHIHESKVWWRRM